MIYIIEVFCAKYLDLFTFVDLVFDESVPNEVNFRYKYI